MSSEFYDGQDLEALANLHHYYAWIVDLLGPQLRGDVMEVGAGTGNFSAAYRDQTDRLTLVEPSQLAEGLSTRFEDDPGITVVRGTLQDAFADHADWSGRFDAIVSVNVLEHVEDHLDLLRTCHQVLRPGGALLLAVPALPFLYGTLDDKVDHIRRYTRGSLNQVVREAGFDVTGSRYFDATGVLPWFLMGRVLKRTTFDPKPAIVYDRFVVPVARRLEALVHPPLGKNVTCVATKPA